MAVVFENSAAAGATSGSSSTITFSFNAGTNADRLVLVGSAAASTDITAATYAGASMTLLDTQSPLKVYYRNGAASGANNLVLTSGTYKIVAYAAAAFSGVDATTPLGTSGKASGTGTAPASPSITLPTDGAIWGIVETGYTTGGSTLVAGSGTTLRSSARASSTGHWAAGGTRTTTGTLAWTGSYSTDWRVIGVPINAAGSGGYTLTADSGSYSLTGQAAGLLVARTVVAGQGSYALTGQDAALTKSILMLAEQGSYALTGQSAGLFAARQLLAEQGAYALSGQDATLTYTSVGAYTLTANSGSYTLTGQDAALLLARTLIAAQGSYALTGQDATLSSGKILLAASGSYALTGQDAAFRRTYALAAGFGSYTLTGQVATLTYSAGIVAILEQVRLRSRITQAVSAPSRITQQLALRSQVRH